MPALVTDGLARTGGHNRQSIPPTQDRIHNALLPFPEGRIAKVIFLRSLMYFYSLNLSIIFYFRIG